MALFSIDCDLLGDVFNSYKSTPFVMLPFSIVIFTCGPILVL